MTDLDQKLNDFIEASTNATNAVTTAFAGVLSSFEACDEAIEANADVAVAIEIFDKAKIEYDKAAEKHSEALAASTLAKDNLVTKRATRVSERDSAKSLINSAKALSQTAIDKANEYTDAKRVLDLQQAAVDAAAADDTADNSSAEDNSSDLIEDIDG